VGGIGTRVPDAQFPLPALLPVIRPETSRRVVVSLPLPCACSLPMMRPEASRKVVREP
jgi:hypothetical protein